jgi:small-conductance mechanosensitive channel
MELLWMIKIAFDTAGIEMPFPQRVIWFGQGESRERLFREGKT